MFSSFAEVVHTEVLRTRKFKRHRFTKAWLRFTSHRPFGNDSFSWSLRWCKPDSRQKEPRRYDLPVKGERTPRSDFESMDPFKVSFCGACSVWLSVGNATNDPPWDRSSSIRIYLRSDCDLDGSIGNFNSI